MPHTPLTQHTLFQSRSLASSDRIAAAVRTNDLRGPDLLMLLEAALALRMVATLLPVQKLRARLAPARCLSIEGLDFTRIAASVLPTVSAIEVQVLVKASLAYIARAYCHPQDTGRPTWSERSFFLGSAQFFCNSLWMHGERDINTSLSRRLARVRRNREIVLAVHDSGEGLDHDDSKKSRTATNVQDKRGHGHTTFACVNGGPSFLVSGFIV